MTKHAQVTPIKPAQDGIGPSPRTSRFFSLYNQYLVEPTADSVDVVDDIHLLLEPVMASIDLLASSMTDENGDIADNPKIVGRVLRGLFYQLQMVDGLLNAIEVRK